MLTLRRGGKAFVVAGLCASVVLIALVSAGLDLHRFLHADACESDHECAITLFAQGLVDAPAGEQPKTAGDRIIGIADSIASTSVLTLIPYRLLPERAPPVFS